MLDDRQKAGPSKQGSSQGLKLFAAMFGVVIAGIAATYLLANDQRHLRELIHRFPSLSLRHNPVQDPPRQTEPMTANAEEPPPPLLPRAGRVPKTLPTFDEETCRMLAGPSPERTFPEYRAEDAGRWECSLLMDYGSAALGRSLFVQIRGGSPGRWRSFRLKLNFGSSSEPARELVEAAVSLSNGLLNLDRANATALREALARGAPFDTAVEGVRLTYRNEPMDETRFNLIATRDSR